MNCSPIQYGSFELRKWALLDNRLLLGIDIGSSLTKIVYLDKNSKNEFTDSKTEFLTLHYALFEKDHFFDAVKWIHERVYLPEDALYRVHVTGQGAKDKEEFIESIFGLRTEYIEEQLTIIAGHRIAFGQISSEKLKASPVVVEETVKFESKFLKQYAESMASKFASEDKDDENNEALIFPCLVIVYGSVAHFYYFDKDGRGEVISGPLTAGAAFLGIGKCLLDTNSYSEIMAMASQGNRANVDTQVKEMLADDINSPYGKLPPELPIFSFGKGMDLNKGLEDFSKNDVARSLVGYFSRIMLNNSLHACQMKGISRTYLSGNMFRSNLFQKEIQSSLLVFKYIKPPEILDFGYFGAMGAMLCDNCDKEKYCKN